ncbi:Protein CBG26400 [Caenorhabditis briggsae]|uniref:Protein CBG26400 n=1 Tax=Caenorhabditis briggsae TaxID=6238 RepID=B6IFF9_CAEBR|nr:Protein CBG26400 [Caenorhabditis briggsae]CAR98639.1 Protein CBG26400 [Caenorhabditis briggsae]
MVGGSEEIVKLEYTTSRQRSIRPSNSPNTFSLPSFFYSIVFFLHF